MAAFFARVQDGGKYRDPPVPLTASSTQNQESDVHEEPRRPEVIDVTVQNDLKPTPAPVILPGITRDQIANLTHYIESLQAK